MRSENIGNKIFRGIIKHKAGNQMPLAVPCIEKPQISALGGFRKSFRSAGIKFADMRCKGSGFPTVSPSHEFRPKTAMGRSKNRAFLDTQNFFSFPYGTAQTNRNPRVGGKHIETVMVDNIVLQTPGQFRTYGETAE